MLNIQKPFIKWVGGKTQLLPSILPLVPNEINNYHELFLGGGSVLLAILSLQRDKKIKINGNVYAYDLNESLIYLFNHIKSNKDELFNTITSIFQEYEAIDSLKCQINERNPQTLEMALKSKESYYYWTRKLYNNEPIGSILRSALFLFLNKTCFRGIYREGPNGFNVPFGNYKKTPSVISRENIDAISHLIQNTQFIHLSFIDSIKLVNEGDFAYIDPPYAPEQTNSFVGYTSCGFNNKLHTLLFNEIKELHSRKARFIMSNAKVPLVISHFIDFNSQDLEARRAINSKKPQSTTTEIIIYN